MTLLPPAVVGIILVLLSVVGIVTVFACVDFLRPPGARARVDHGRRGRPGLKGIARATTASRPVASPAAPRRAHHVSAHRLHSEGHA